MFFKDIIGQEYIQTKLRNMVQTKRLPHALMLHGTAGAGTFALALALARYMNCSHPTTTDGCGECASCKKITKLSHPDLHFIFPIIKDSKKKKEISDDYITEWRSFILDHPYFNETMWVNSLGTTNAQAKIFVKESSSILYKMNFKPYEAEQKIVILWLPEKMQTECANKLLKLIEEPAPHTHFIMISENPEEVLGTILSRCQLIRVPLIKEEAIRTFLERKDHLDPSTIDYLTHVSNGDYIKVLDLFKTDKNKKEYFEAFVALMRLAYMRNIILLKQWSDSNASKGREYIKHLFQYAQYMLRESFIANLHNSTLTYMNIEEQNFASKFAPFIHENNIQQLTDQFEIAEKEIERNINAKIILFDLSLQIATLLKRTI